ncbi:glutamyl-tRNA reductase [Ethanoligenens sp.]|uniref:glutamyl-tRNA reductase n=1 Tax=Ethanoligenens sp. TaxID=2099655 RepID=UPI0039E7B2F1
MNILMAGVDHTTAAIAERERFTFTKTQMGQALTFCRAQAGVTGAVLLCTCNRTELYLSTHKDAPVNPAALLTQTAHLRQPAERLLQVHTGKTAARHLMEVACGLCSALRGDDQILTQVRQALELARAAHSTSSVLETLFRLSVTAAKKVKTQVQLRAVPVSAAAGAVELLTARLGSLAGRKALVIGNGEMGRLSAELLQKAGCTVTVTLRSYHHGETVVPYGCLTIPYDSRLHAAAEADILLSATSSPHFTLTRDMLQNLPSAPRQCIDLAVPRDIDPTVADLPGISYADIDALDKVDHTVPDEQMQQILDICTNYLDQFTEWNDGRILRETADELAQAIEMRVRAELDAGAGDGDDTAYAVRRAVETMFFSLKEHCTPELLHVLRQASDTARLRTR